MRAVRCASWLSRLVGEGPGAAVGVFCRLAHRPPAEGGEGVVGAEREHGMQARHPGPQWWLRYMLLLTSCCCLCWCSAMQWPGVGNVHTENGGIAQLRLSTTATIPCLTEALGRTTGCCAHSIRSAVHRQNCKTEVQDRSATSGHSVAMHRLLQHRGSPPMGALGTPAATKRLACMLFLRLPTAINTRRPKQCVYIQHYCSGKGSRLGDLASSSSLFPPAAARRPALYRD